MREGSSDKRDGGSLRVLHVVSTLSARGGGPSRAALDMCEVLADRGLTVTLCSTNLDGVGGWLAGNSPRVLHVPLAQPLVKNGVEIRYFPTRWPHRFARSPALASSLRTLVPQFDVLHLHSLYQFPTLVGAHYARKFRVPYIIRPHGTLDPYLRRRHRFQKAIYNRAVERRNLNSAAAIHYTSTVEMEVATALGIKAPGVVIPLGIRMEEFAALPQPGRFRARFPALRRKRLVVFIGRLIRKKGFDLLVPAFASIARRLDDAHLVIAGPDDEGYGATVRRLVADAGLGNRVTMLGMVQGPQKLELLRDANVWVLPSYTENFGLAAVEAMACALPIVITDKVDIQREVAEAGAGLVVPCRVADLATAIYRILTDQALGHRLGSAATELVGSRFTWEASGAKLVDLYERLRTRSGKETHLDRAATS